MPPCPCGQFGLHDNGDNSSAALAEYEIALTNFTKRLVATGSKLLYISTTPFMPQEYYGNRCVPELNTIAQKVMKKYHVAYADVYSWIMQKCGGGKTYTSCPLCDNEPWKNPGAPVSWAQLHQLGLAVCTSFCLAVSRSVRVVGLSY